MKLGLDIIAVPHWTFLEQDGDGVATLSSGALSMTELVGIKRVIPH